MSAGDAAPLAPDPAIEASLDKKEKKRLKRLQKALEDAQRPLDPWERYRALVDAFEMEQDLVDLADHKARFALLIMGTLNAVTFIVGTRSEALAVIPFDMRVYLSLYLGSYALLALYFFVQAIESLRPREAKPNVRYRGEGGLEDYPMGLRFFVDVLQRDLNAYRAAWRSVHVSQLNAEVALQIHALARINKAKYRALQRLYVGLKGMTLLTAGLLSAIALVAFRSDAAARAPAVAGALPGPLHVLDEPQRLSVPGVREPSGVAFHAASGRLYAVGDDGSLAELDRDGHVQWTVAGLGNLEDVAVHAPSGRLLLLSEKASQLLLFDPASRRRLAAFRLDKRELLGREPSADSNTGFEGLAFRPEPGRPGGGVVYLTHQRAPALVVSIAFDPDGGDATIGAEAVLSRVELAGFRSLKGAAWVPQLERLLVVADHRDRLLVLGAGGAVELEIALAGLQQEGVAADDGGNLWIADDRAGLLRFPGGLEAIRQRLPRAAAQRTTTQEVR